MKDDRNWFDVWAETMTTIYTLLFMGLITAFPLAIAGLIVYALVLLFQR